MNPAFESWLTANNYDAAALTPTQRKHLEAAWKAEVQAQTAPVAPIPTATLAQPQPPVPTVERAPSTPGVYEAELAAARRESERRNSIDALVAEQIRADIGFPERLERLDLIRKAAVEGSWDLQKTQFEILKESRRVGPIVSIVREQETNADVLEAAALRAVGYPGIEKKFNDRILSTVDKNYPRGIGLKELVLAAAERNSGYRGSSRDIAAMCRAAFRSENNHNHPSFRADAGPSTIDVTGILSNVANKFLEAGFLYVEQAWRGIAKIRPANDYKEMSIFRMTGSATFEKVGPGGEIKHGTLGELSYGLKVDPYAKMIGISEQDLRNDDLGAFSGVSEEIGRGAGDSLNEIFWAVWLDDAAFFNTDKSKGNYDDGAADTALALAGLNNAETIFRLQTKPDGKPLGAMPAVLLVPATLYNTALQLMGSQGLVVGTTPASGPQNNVFYGRYRTVSSVFLDAASTTAWYLLADPNAIPGIAIAFLDGVQTPTVETGQFDFDRLGLAMRGVMRFGVRKQEYRCGVKLKGVN